MKVVLYSMFDTKTSLYHAPIVSINGDSARRHYAQIFANGQNPYYDYAEDYQLMAVGTFSDETGKTEGLGAPEFIAHGTTLAKMADQLKIRRSGEGGIQSEQ